MPQKYIKRHNESEKVKQSHGSCSTNFDDLFSINTTVSSNKITQILTIIQKNNVIFGNKKHSEYSPELSLTNKNKPCKTEFCSIKILSAVTFGGRN